LVGFWRKTWFSVSKTDPTLQITSALYRSSSCVVLAQWMENGAAGVSGPNAVPAVAEEYSDDIAHVSIRSMVATVASATHRKLKSAT